MYTRWYRDKLWVMIPAQAVVKQFPRDLQGIPTTAKIGILQHPISHRPNVWENRLE
jgi:hypothetical protein